MRQVVEFSFDEPRAITGVALTAGGKVQLLEDNAVAIPRSARRTNFYDRKKGEKRLATVPLAPAEPHLDLTRALLRYDTIFAIDTNTVEIDGKRVSVSAVVFADVRTAVSGEVRLRVAPVAGLEFYECAANPEQLGWCTLQSMIVSSPDYSAQRRYALVSDCDSSRHNVYNRRQAPIFGDTFLAPNFELIYASADAGREVVNHLIKMCDREATSIIRALRSGSLAGNLPTVRSGPCSHFRAGFFPIRSERLLNWPRFGPGLPFELEKPQV